MLTTLQEEMKIAMKARDQARVDALRLMISAIKYVEVDLPVQAGTPKIISDEQIVEVLKKEAKKRREAIEAYKAAGRDEQAKQEQYELTLIEEYLPKMMGEEEVREKVLSIKNQVLSMGNFGAGMKIAMEAVGKGAEGAMVAKIVKELFNPKS
ncbi:MAG: GatB/YqeY domain-containing protein [bacterium]